MELLKKDFYFDLPQELIAQDPLADRSASRLRCSTRRQGRQSIKCLRILWIICIQEIALC